MSLRFRAIERNVVELTTPDGIYRLTANELAKALRAAEECTPTPGDTLQPGAYVLARSENPEILAFFAALKAGHFAMPLPDLLRWLNDVPPLAGYLYYVGPTTRELGNNLLFVMRENTPAGVKFTTLDGGGRAVAGDCIFYATKPDTDGVAYIEGNLTEVPPLN